MPRADLLALTLDDLAAMSNRGTVKRAERELETTQCTIDEEADGTVRFTWSDNVKCAIAAGKVVADGTCSCPATELCRHLVRSVLAYQKQTPSLGAEQPAASAAWNPGAISDEDLGKHFKPAALTRLQERFGRGLLV